MASDTPGTPEGPEPYDMAMANRLSRSILVGSVIFAAIHGALIWLKLPG